MPEPSPLKRLGFFMTVYSDFMAKCALKKSQPKTEQDISDSDKWIKLRRKVIELYGTTCMKCGVECTLFSKCKTSRQRAISLHVDHIVPKSRNRELEFDISNLQILCATCNVEKMTGFADYRNKLHLEKLDVMLSKSRKV